jgi:hypothetical protein
VFKRLFQRWAIPGWLVLAFWIAIELLDWWHRIDFVGSKLKANPSLHLAFEWIVSGQGRTCLGLFGFILLFLAVSRKATEKPSGTKTANQFDAPQAVQTYEINFDHLPKNMLEAGWFLAYPKNSPVKPKAVFLPEAPVAGSIAIDAPSDHAFEYRLPQSVYPSNKVVFAAKYLSGTMIFLRFLLQPKSGNDSYGKWVKILVGTDQSFPTPKYEDQEWTLKVPGKPLGNGWRHFDLFLPDVIKNTWGAYGLLFENVTIIRLRSSLEISPIRFYEEPSA